jgi:hypothetical protein
MPSVNLGGCLNDLGDAIIGLRPAVSSTLGISSGTHGLGPPCLSAQLVGAAAVSLRISPLISSLTHVLLQWRLHGCIVRSSRFMATLSVAPLEVSLFPHRKICRQELALPACDLPTVSGVLLLRQFSSGPGLHCIYQEVDSGIFTCIYVATSVYKNATRACI